MSRIIFKTILLATVVCSGLFSTSRTLAQPSQPATPNVQIVEENGVRYQVTRSRVMQPVRDYRYVDQQQVYYQQRYRTEMRPTTQSTYGLQTTYEYVPRLYDWWRVLGIFGEPYVAYGAEPRTRWVRQTHNVHVPVARTEVVPFTRTVRTSVPYLRFEEREQESKVALGPASSASQDQLASTQAPSSSAFQPATPRPPVAARPYIPAAPSLMPPPVATADPYRFGNVAQSALPSTSQLAPPLGRRQTVTGDTFQTRPWHAGGAGTYPQSSIGGNSNSVVGSGSHSHGGVARMDSDPPRFGTSMGSGGTFQARR